MPNITSTMTAPVQYNIYAKSPGGENRVKTSVTIQGGANVADKHFITPEGVVTHVTEEQLALLIKDDTFKTHLNGGFVKIHRTEKMQAQDMEKKDKSAPITPKDYAKKGKAAPKTKKG